MSSESIMFVMAVLTGIMFLITAKMISDGSLMMNYDKATEAKVIEIRNALLYLNVVEEGKRIIKLPAMFKVYLEKENVTVECNVPFFCTGGLRHTRSLVPMNEEIISPAEVDSRSICLSKRISNCRNNITICLPEDNCCKFNPLSETLCTSLNPY